MSKFERDADKESFWRLAVGEQRASGLSVRAFCSREGLTESNFYAWRRQLVRRDAEASAAGSPKFVEATAAGRMLCPLPGAGASDEVASSLELVLPRGVVVRAPDGFDAQVLRRLVEALT